MEYLNKKKAGMSSLAVSTTLDLTVSLKPQYALYFERHGAPPEGVFDSEKLAAIIKDLLNEEKLTEEDVFGSNTIDCSENNV